MPSSPLTASPRVGKVIELLCRGGGGGGGGGFNYAAIYIPRGPRPQQQPPTNAVIATHTEISRDSKDFR